MSAPTTRIYRDAIYTTLGIIEYYNVVCVLRVLDYSDLTFISQNSAFTIFESYPIEVHPHLIKPNDNREVLSSVIFNDYKI